MLTADIKNALKGYMTKLEKPVTLVVQNGEHAKRAELVSFLTEVAETGDLLALEERELDLRSPISFLIEANGEDTGIRFSGIPGGHEFNSLILAILNAGSHESKLDAAVQNMIKAIDEPMQFEVFISLSCHNCPDVVQALNQFALLNPQVRSEMVDGGLFQDVIKERDIQGVPSVYLNGELFANGKVTAAELVDKLLERNPSLAQAPTESLPTQDVVVLGGGPAGVSAAIYAARKGLKVTLVADRIGGQVKDTLGIENLIGVPQTTGDQLTGQMTQHMRDYDITMREHQRVTEVIDGTIKKLVLKSGEIIKTKTMIVATGAKWRELGVPGEKENIGNGVAYCPHCDGPFFKGKDVAVIGGGNSGVEAALDLAGIVRNVTLIEYGETLRADQVLVDKARGSANINIVTQAATQEIVATGGKVSALRYQDRDTQSDVTVDLSAVFVQIGLVPNGAFLGDLVEKTPSGEIVVDDKCRTNKPGIYACGDVTTVPYKQIIISMGEGAKAALAAFEYLMLEGETLVESDDEALVA